MSESGKGIEGNREVFLSAKQVAARYGMTTHWVYSCPEMKAIRRTIGRTIRWALSDLQILERTDRDKATGAKTTPLDWAKQIADKEREKRVKFILQ